MVVKYHYVPLHKTDPRLHCQRLLNYSLMGPKSKSYTKKAPTSPEALCPCTNEILQAVIISNEAEIEANLRTNFGLRTGQKFTFFATKRSKDKIPDFSNWLLKATQRNNWARGGITVAVALSNHFNNPDYPHLISIGKMWFKDDVGCHQFQAKVAAEVPVGTLEIHLSIKNYSVSEKAVSADGKILEQEIIPHLRSTKHAFPKTLVKSTYLNPTPVTPSKRNAVDFILPR